MRLGLDQRRHHGQASVFFVATALPPMSDDLPLTKDDAQSLPPLASTSTMPTPQNMCKYTLEEDFICACTHFTTANVTSQQQKTVEIEHKIEIATPTHDHKSLFLLPLITTSCIGTDQCGKEWPVSAKRGQQQSMHHHHQSGKFF
jgi:hypothetical protein